MSLAPKSKIGETWEIEIAIHAIPPEKAQEVEAPDIAICFPTVRYGDKDSRLDAFLRVEKLRSVITGPIGISTIVISHCRAPFVVHNVLDWCRNSVSKTRALQIIIQRTEILRSEVLLKVV